MPQSIFGEYDRLMRYEEKDDDGDFILVVSTIRATDTQHPYETAISDADINPGCWKVVEEYDSLEEAQEGHARWIALMTSENKPTTLEDVSTCWAKGEKGQKLVDLINEVGGSCL